MSPSRLSSSTSRRWRFASFHTTVDSAEAQHPVTSAGMPVSSSSVRGEATERGRRMRHHSARTRGTRYIKGGPPDFSVALNTRVSSIRNLSRQIRPLTLKGWKQGKSNVTVTFSPSATCEYRGRARARARASPIVRKSPTRGVHANASTTALRGRILESGEIERKEESRLTFAAISGDWSVPTRDRDQRAGYQASSTG